MKPRNSRLRATCLAASAVAVVALVAAPAAQAADNNGGKPHGPKFSASQLAKASKTVTPRVDGTPGQVATVQGDSSTPLSQDGVTPQNNAGSSNDKNVKGFVSKGSVETLQGATETMSLGSTGDWVAMTSSGNVARYDKNGDAVWSFGAHDFDAAWQATYRAPYTGSDFTPDMYEGFNPYQMGSTGTHPYAQLDVNHDGVPDIAVAYNLGSSSQIPFTVPDSDLSTGTFINVLDGKSGKMLWHTLVPGTVGSMLAQDGQLIAAETTGPNWDLDPVAHQGSSRSSLLSYTFSGSGDAVKGTQNWVYDTKVPYADWSDLTSMGAGKITVGWSDTPMGLGEPRPAAGHVLVVDTTTGKADLDVKTPGYPRIVQPDASGTGVLVAEQNDPLSAVYWQLTDINSTSGARTVLANRNSAIPNSLQINRNAKDGQPTYIGSELGINADLSNGESSVFGLNADGSQDWSYTTASSTGAAETAVLDVELDTRGQGQVLVTTSDGVATSRTAPEGPYQTQLLALGTADGKVKWLQSGAVAGDTITPYNGGYLTVGYSLTAFQTNINGKTTAQQPLLADLYATDSYDVNGDGTPDIITGGISHGVFALDGKALADGRTTVLWKAPVSGSVHDVKVAKVVDAKGAAHTRVVAATSNGFAVMDPATGSVVSDVATGAFQYKVVVSGGRILASSKTAFGSYDESGRTEWTYRPAGAGTKQVLYSTPGVDAKGHIFLETGGQRTAIATGASDPVPTAVGLDAATGKQLWTVDTPTVQPGAEKSSWIEQQSGVYASTDIPGADGDGVAFAFGGNKPASLGHTVVLIKGSTGEVVKTMTSTGAQTFGGYASSSDQGLLWLHWYKVSTLQPGTGTQKDVGTIANNPQGVVGYAQDGSEMFFGTEAGIQAYTLPLAAGSDGYAHSTGSAFGYFAGHLTALPLYSGKTTTLVAVQQDYLAYNLNENVGGFGTTWRATDLFPHGLTVLQATGKTAATGSIAAAAAPTATAASKGSTATALKQNYMPVAVASAPHVIESKKAVPDSATPAATSAIRGYTPQQIQQRLGLSADGSGQTVAISIAYDYPNAESDVNTFSTQFGLPLTCGSEAADATDCFDFKTVYAEGSKPVQDDGWNEEAALDIDTIHSIVPKAKIILVEGKDASAEGLYKAVDVAATFNPDAINNSWGMGEFSEESFYDQHCALDNTLCTQSTGDDGWPSGYSSTSPYALAVGGTKMTLAADGSTASEVAWASGGGGFSFFEKQPAYQQGVVKSDFRATPDVSFNADPNTGVAVYVTVADGTHYWMQVGGTSLSSPSWAAILTAADQLRQADGKAKFVSNGADGDTMHRAIYSLGSALSDITSGTNGACEQECTAGTGFDTVTGLGSPLAGIDKALASK